MLQVVAAEPLSTTIELRGQPTLDEVVARLHASGVSDEEIRVERISCPDDETTDTDLGLAMRRGALVGVPGIYVVMVIVALLAGGTMAEALGIALVPAIVGGPFFGAFVFLNARLAQVEGADHVVHTHEVDQIVVTGEHAAELRSVAEGLSAEAA